jgi:hypothetical protein
MVLVPLENQVDLQFLVHLENPLVLELLKDLGHLYYL